jgi:putative membrane-bound dehydrogenase-like protein
LFALTAGAAEKKICFMAGTASHGYGSHEHYAGCMILANALRENMPGYEIEVFRNGWPKNQAAFDGADAIVMYCDGGGRHPANKNLEQIDKLAKKGVGVVCIHYGVEVPKGEPGKRFLDWIGGYFETNWSVNPHWTAEFKSLPKHEITRGVKPFEINDEWYYHMRFRDEMKGVTPILTAIPPASTLRRKDGPHSGNPHVRKKAGQPQHVAWAAERPGGGRGFGFTGGHFHWNWGDDNFRTLMLNAIVWTAHGDIPSGGVKSARLTVPDLQKNQDYDPPKNFNLDSIRQRLKLQSSATGSGRGAKPLFTSPVITPNTPGHAVDINVALKGAKQLYLVVADGGNGYGCDWADWAEPRLVGPDGEKKLTELKWKSATTQWGQVRANKNAAGKPLKINGKSVAYGIGTHANSIIAFDIPAGYTHFKARGGLDNGGTDQAACGNAASVQFSVYSSQPSLASATGGAAGASRSPVDAVSGLDVAEGLEATLFASEPRLLSLTNLDIDHRGRVWVCEVVNYRKHNGKRKEGDRILILEDTTGDGVADSSKVFYQGRDVDSAMGICVLGNRVYVSCSPNVLVFTDTNGDDKPDKKEVLFSNTGQPQHDHSAHSFIFGPDGKMYWNFGNTGKAVSDAAGKPIVDKFGNPVVDNGKPYFGGMPFRCNADGSEFEVLAHNFRNNYEVTVDSFGTLWQSDNDDDGNRAVRINYVMEHGNYGYRDQMTGGGWRDVRTGMHEEIPLRHWHLRDPGVVPNLLQTGAGSPTGITVYEGRLLPKPFWDQVIHCDAGPNVVRAYPATPDGAGYKAKILNVVHGARDNWFRPADVCVAPDGSLFVTDWYDPGVGGHNMGDLDRGRLFRIAPPDTPYKKLEFDFSTVDGAIDALRNPNLSVRYLAWTALHEMGAKAEPALQEMLNEADNPRHRARALWLLCKQPERGADYVDRALAHRDANLRIVGIRAARQIGVDVIGVVKKLVNDESPAVRRECAIALRGDESSEMPKLWAQLATSHDGADRWYLEALGIGADLRWDDCLAAWQAEIGSEWKAPAGRDIVWRSRSKQTPQLLAELIGSTPLDQLPRYFRSFDFLPASQARQDALMQVAFTSRGVDAQAKGYMITQAIRRLGNIDLSRDPAKVAAVNRALTALAGRAEFVELVAKFSLTTRYPDLLTIAEGENPEAGIAAVRALLDKNQSDLLTGGLRQEKAVQAAALARAMYNSADGRAVRLLLPIVSDSKVDLEVRRQATRAASRTKAGAARLIALAKDGKLEPALKSAAAFHLNSSRDANTRNQAAKLFPLPPTKGNKPLPPIDQLVRMTGNGGNGEKLFATSGNCAKCHVVNGKGKEVGPDLSEIGRKLSRHALFESIIYPSAGISHNYETYSLALDSGVIVNGVLLSRTNESISIRLEDAISRTFKLSEIDELKKSDQSLMPADLQKILSLQDLVDVVEHLTTLKQAAKK